METITFNASNGSTMMIEGSKIKVVNKFGDEYYGTLDQNGKVSTRQRFGLGYILAALNEYRNR